jgi:Flp pilus assembly protein TadD
MRMSGALRSLIGAAAVSAALISCTSYSDDGYGRNPAAKMAVRSPEGYPNGKAAARNNDGIDHLGWEHWRKAAADFNRAIEADPGMAAAHFNLALALDRLGRHDEARAEFRTALDLAPDDPRIAENEILKKNLGAGP